MRTTQDAADATDLLQKTLEGLGGGGHSHRAGGELSGAGRNGAITDALEVDLRDRWLAACRIDRQRGTRLVTLREIVDNL